MSLRKPIEIITLEDFISNQRSTKSFIDYCKDLEQSITELTTAIEARRLRKSSNTKHTNDPKKD